MTRVRCYLFDPCIYRDTDRYCTKDYIRIVDESVNENFCTSRRTPIPDEFKDWHVPTPEERKREMDEEAKAVADKIVKALRKGDG